MSKLEDVTTVTGPARTDAPARPLAVIIAEHPFFKGMSPAHLQVLADCAMQTEFREGQPIFHEGDPANRFYIIQEGEVALESRKKDQPPVLIQTIGPGDVLGWSWLFAPYYWHFDARAIKATKAIFFYGTRLLASAEVDHDLGFELIRRMARVMMQRLQATRRQLLELHAREKF